jgi:hypothetical protein
MRSSVNPARSAAEYSADESPRSRAGRGDRTAGPRSGAACARAISAAATSSSPAVRGVQRDPRQPAGRRSISALMPAPHLRGCDERLATETPVAALSCGLGGRSPAPNHTAWEAGAVGAIRRGLGIASVGLAKTATAPRAAQPSPPRRGGENPVPHGGQPRWRSRRSANAASLRRLSRCSR